MQLSLGFAADPRCTWLKPGCAEPGLAAAGCYDNRDLGCQPDTGCANGRSCLVRNINPCPDSMNCMSCSAPLGICS